MRIIVTGSRSAAKYSDEECERLQDELYAKLDLEEADIIVHGDCPESPDQWASEYCQYSGTVEEKHPANWKAYGKSAGFIRNYQMADLGADLCIAVWDGKSNGTKNMIVEAVCLGIPVKIIPCPEPKSR